MLPHPSPKVFLFQTRRKERSSPTSLPERRDNGISYLPTNLPSLSVQLSGNPLLPLYPYPYMHDGIQSEVNISFLVAQPSGSCHFVKVGLWNKLLPIVIYTPPMKVHGSEDDAVHLVLGVILSMGLIKNEKERAWMDEMSPRYRYCHVAMIGNWFFAKLSWENGVELDGRNQISTRVVLKSSNN